MRIQNLHHQLNNIDGCFKVSVIVLNSLDSLELLSLLELNFSLQL